MQEADNVSDGFQGTTQVEQLLFFHVHAFYADALQRWTHIEKILVGEFIFLLYDADELCHFFQTTVDFIVCLGEGHIVYAFLAQCAETFFL